MLAWFQLLDRASSAAEVIAIARDYVATWDPEELSRLPGECRPGRVKTVEDLEDLHGCLVEEYRRNRVVGPGLAALQNMTSFMVRASVRMAQLRCDAEAAYDEPQAVAADRVERRREPQ